MLLRRFKDILDYREMLKNLIIRDLRTRYRESILGFFWTLLNPLLMLLIYTIAFKTILRMDMPNYSVFLFSGLLPWLYFQSTVSICSTIIVSNSGIVKKVYFPNEILPLGATIAGAVNYCLTLIALVVAMIIFQVPFTISLLYLPIILITQMLLILGLGLLLSAMNVFFRDIEHIVGILFMAWFYLTPIFYPVSLVPEKYRQLYYLNPMTNIEQSYQSIFYYGEDPQLSHLALSFVISIGILLIGYTVFIGLKKRFAEEL